MKNSEKIRVKKGNRVEHVTKNQAAEKSHGARPVQSKPLSGEDLKKFVQHDLRAAIYVLEVVLSNEDILERVLEQVQSESTKQQGAAVDHQKTNLMKNG